MTIERCRVPGPSEDTEWQSPVFNTSCWQYLSEPGVWPMHVSQFQWTRQSRIVLHKVCNRASCSCNRTFFMPWMKIDWWFYLNHQCRLIVSKVLCLCPLPKPSGELLVHLYYNPPVYTIFRILDTPFYFLWHLSASQHSDFDQLIYRQIMVFISVHI